MCAHILLAALTNKPNLQGGLGSGMRIEIGHVEALPVSRESPRSERLEAATMGWHGLEGDKRLAAFLAYG